VKHHGALLAKGWLLGVQFDTLFTDDLYMRISANAVNQALRLKQALLDKGYELFCDSMTNQQFVVLENSKVKEMLPRAGFKLWEKFDETRSVVRFATSWATTDEQIDELIAML
jgi:threonine aldolase